MTNALTKAGNRRTPNKSQKGSAAAGKKNTPLKDFLIQKKSTPSKGLQESTKTVVETKDDPPCIDLDSDDEDFQANSKESATVSPVAKASFNNLKYFFQLQKEWTPDHDDDLKVV